MDLIRRSYMFLEVKGLKFIEVSDESLNQDKMFMNSGPYSHYSVNSVHHCKDRFHVSNHGSHV